MGRGLSEKQQGILQYMKRKQAKGFEVTAAAELLAYVYGLEPRFGRGWETTERFLTFHRHWNFRAAENPEYYSAKASLSRSLLRLEARGLVVRHVLGFTSITQWETDTGTAEQKFSAWGYRLTNTAWG